MARSMARRIIGRPADFFNLPWVLFWDPWVVKIGFLAKVYADFAHFHNFSTDFLKIKILKKLIFLVSLRFSFVLLNE